MNTIPHFIRSAIEHSDMSYRAIAIKAEAAGYVLSHSTVSTYATGRTRNYSREKLEAIAVGLGLSKDAFMERAGMPTLGEPFDLPQDAALLEPHEREAVRSVVNAFIQNRRRQAQDAKDEPAAVEPDEDAGDYELAASHGDEGIAPDEDPHTT